MRQPLTLTVLAFSLLAGHAQSTFIADFNTDQNFATGVGSTGWAGAYGGNNPSSTFQSSGGQLTISDTGGHWEYGSTSGHLLYLSVAGDFTMETTLTSISTSSYATAGIGAFDPSVTTGDPTVTWIGLFDKGFYGNGYLGTRTVVNGSLNDDQGQAGNINDSMPVTLEMTRVGDVFTQYYSLNGTDFTELDSAVMASLPQTLDVGIWDGSFSGNTSTSVFNSFSLETTPEPGTLTLAGLGLAGWFAARRRHH